MKIAIGQKVKELRKRRGWTQSELAEKAGFNTPSSIGRIEADLWQPGLDIVMDLADILGCTPQELLGWDTADGKTTEVMNIMNSLSEEDQERVLQFAKYILWEKGNGIQKTTE